VGARFPAGGGGGAHLAVHAAGLALQATDEQRGIFPHPLGLPEEASQILEAELTGLVSDIFIHLGDFGFRFSDQLGEVLQIAKRFGPSRSTKSLVARRTWWRRRVGGLHGRQGARDPAVTVITVVGIVTVVVGSRTVYSGRSSDLGGILRALFGCHRCLVAAAGDAELAHRLVGRSRKSLFPYFALALPRRGGA
jgi:hypothetical protein